MDHLMHLRKRYRAATIGHVRPFVSVLLLGTIVPSLSAQFEEGFEKKIAAEWTLLMDSVNNAKWEEESQFYYARQRDNMPMRRKEKIEYEFKRGVGNLYGIEIDEMSFEKQPASRSVALTLINEKYVAKLGKRDGRGGWLLNDHVPVAANPAKWRRYERHFPWMEFGSLALLEAIKGGLTIIKVEKAPAADDASTLRCFFTYETGEKTSNRLKRTGYIDFDQGRWNRPRRYELQFVSDYIEGENSGAFEYGVDQADMPIIKSISREGRSKSVKKGVVFSKETQVYSKVGYNQGGRDEVFRLSNYGLPEPHGVVWPKPTPWWIWILATAVSILCAWAAIYLLRARHKRRKIGVTLTSKEAPPWPPSGATA